MTSLDRAARAAQIRDAIDALALTIGSDNVPRPWVAVFLEWLRERVS